MSGSRVINVLAAYPTGAIFRSKGDPRDIFVVSTVRVERGRVLGVEGTRTHLDGGGLSLPMLTIRELEDEWFYSHMYRIFQPDAYTMILEAP